MSSLHKQATETVGLKAQKIKRSIVSIDGGGLYSIIRVQHFDLLYCSSLISFSCIVLIMFIMYMFDYSHV